MPDQFDTAMQPYEGEFSEEDMLKMHRMYENLIGQVESALSEGIPRGNIVRGLRDEFDRVSALGKMPDQIHRMMVIPIVENAVERVMWDRNSHAGVLEGTGEIDRAVELYETNVADCYDRMEPYERLRIIYRQRKDFDNALRVCKQAIINLRFPHEREKIAK